MSGMHMHTHTCIYIYMYTPIYAHTITPDPTFVYTFYIIYFKRLYFLKQFMIKVTKMHDTFRRWVILVNSQFNENKYL